MDIKREIEWKMKEETATRSNKVIEKNIFSSLSLL